MLFLARTCSEQLEKAPEKINFSYFIPLAKQNRMELGFENFDVKLQLKQPVHDLKLIEFQQFENRLEKL